MKRTIEKKSLPQKKNLTYNDVEDIIEELVRVKAHKATFDCWDVDDIAQEIRIICLNALKKFDYKKADTRQKIKNYLGTSVDNRLFNLRRDKHIRFAPPFSKRKVQELDENPESDPENYEKLKAFRKTLEKKKIVKNTISISMFSDLRDARNNFSEIEARDFISHIIENVNEDLRNSILSFLNGEKHKLDENLERQLRSILEE